MSTDTAADIEARYLMQLTGAREIKVNKEVSIYERTYEQ